MARPVDTTRAIGRAAGLGAALVVQLTACASQNPRQAWPQPAPQAEVASPASAAEQPPEAAPARATPAAPPVQVPDTKEVTRARRLVDSGLRLYRQGDYDKAEAALKEAMTLYPFLAEANLVLGKIFLIRASATRDMTMMNSARLMFEMARALDPEAREPDMLLELFQGGGE